MIALTLAPLLLAAAQSAPTIPDAATQARVERVLREAPVIDGHNDLAWELRKSYDGAVEAVDLTRDTAKRSGGSTSSCPNPMARAARGARPHLGSGRIDRAQPDHHSGRSGR